MYLIDHRQSPRKFPVMNHVFGKKMLCALFITSSLVGTLTTPVVAIENALIGHCSADKRSRCTV